MANNLSPREIAELDVLYRRAVSNNSPVDATKISSDINHFPDSFRQTLMKSTFKRDYDPTVTGALTQATSQMGYQLTTNRMTEQSSE